MVRRLVDPPAGASPGGRDCSACLAGGALQVSLAPSGRRLRDVQCAFAVLHMIAISGVTDACTGGTRGQTRTQTHLRALRLVAGSFAGQVHDSTGHDDEDAPDQRIRKPLSLECP